MLMSGEFVISLDFELLWGVRDHSNRDGYGTNILGAREAVPRLLELFAEANIQATWAVVGFLFCESKEELIDSMPLERPAYFDSRLSNYNYLDEVGKNESSDPYYFAPSLIERIKNTPGQEIGTHTLSHYYCLEPGQTLEAFEADIGAARGLALSRGIDLRSIVFPRNQYAPEHIEVCNRFGITAYRGNPDGWAYLPARGREQTYFRRALRLADAYTGFLGAHTYRRSGSVPGNVPASRFLRPCSGRLAPFHPFHISTIRKGMTAAAQSGSGFHLWWHPHNFGRELAANLDGMRNIISHFNTLRDSEGMISMSMAGRR